MTKIRDILDDIIEGLEALEEEEVQGQEDEAVAQMILETILADMRAKEITTGRMSRFKGGGWKAHIGYEGRIYYVAVKEA